MSFDEFVREVERLPRRQMWRYGQAGDLPGDGDRIDRDQMIRLAKANRNRPVIAFTHKPPTLDNLQILEEARELGFPVNLSANTLDHADVMTQHGFNVVVVLPENYQKKASESQAEYKSRLRSLPQRTKEGHKIAVCPATYTDTDCLNCGVCATKEPRGAIIGFPAHGTKRKTVSAMATARGIETNDCTAGSG